MCGRLDGYLQAFARLIPDDNKTFPTKRSRCDSPETPCLLLAVLDHIAGGTITRNFIELSFALTETFQKYLSLLPPSNRKRSIAYPFYQLQNSNFWTLKPKPSQGQTDTAEPPGSVEQLRTRFFGAELNSDLFTLLQMPASREKFREVLLTTYFTKDVQRAINNNDPAL